MSIPSVRPYHMPKEKELPANIASWRIGLERSVLLIHDMQHYFIRCFPADQPPVTDLIANISRLRDCCVEMGIPIIYSAQPGGMNDAQRGLLKDFWGPGMSSEPMQRAIIPELTPRSDDTILTKWRYSAFHRTDLLEFMRSQRRDQIIICGVYAHVGCLMTASEAFSNDIETFLVVDAIADFSDEYHRAAVTYAAQNCAVALATATVLQTMTASPFQSTNPSLNIAGDERC